MRTVVDFPDRSAVADEAAEWLIRLDADQPPTREELRTLGEWLHRSPVHREELERLAALWSRMNVLTELAVPLGTSSQLARRARFTHWFERLDCVPRAGWVAASLVIVLALTTGWFLRQAATDRLQSTNGLYATAIGQHHTTTLSDGSQVVLNTNTQIRVDFERGYRRVLLLRGEALFTVAKDASRPFRVYAGTGRIEALGTAFSVYLDGANVNVAVTEGRVSLASASSGASTTATVPRSTKQSGASSLDERMQSIGTLEAWQVATIRPAVVSATERTLALEAIRPVAPSELQERLAWRDGVLVFSGETIEEVVRQFSRYTTVVIEVPDPQVRSMRVGGRFPVAETETMLAALETNFNLRVTRVGHDHVVISAAE